MALLQTNEKFSQVSYANGSESHENVKRSSGLHKMMPTLTGSGHSDLGAHVKHGKMLLLLTNVAWTTFSRGENESLSFRDQVLSRSLASIFFWWLFDKLDTHEQCFSWNYEINHDRKYL